MGCCGTQKKKPKEQLPPPPKPDPKPQTPPVSPREPVRTVIDKKKTRLERFVGYSNGSTIKYFDYHLPTQIQIEGA